MPYQQNYPTKNPLCVKNLCLEYPPSWPCWRGHRYYKNPNHSQEIKNDKKTIFLGTIMKKQIENKNGKKIKIIKTTKEGNKMTSV